jgi:hypothetical protein
VVCKNVDGHFHKVVDGVDVTGKCFVRVSRYSCHRPDCPVCVGKWAVREAHHVDDKLVLGAKHFGLVEHIIISVPEKCYGLDYKSLKSYVLKVCKSRGILGGCIVYHPWRFDGFEWHFGKHFHVLGFIDGGASRCRKCVKGSCVGCHGFFHRVDEGYKKDGWVVRVEEERISVYMTMKYELGHAAVLKDGKRNLIVTWFGCMRNGKLKVERKKSKCPACGESLVRMVYMGFERLVVGDCWMSDEDEVNGVLCCFVDFRFYGRDG